MELDHVQGQVARDMRKQHDGGSRAERERTLTLPFTIDGPANLLTLRADLNSVFDEGHFCLVPKVGETDKSRGEADGRETADIGRDGATAAERNPPRLVLHVFNSTPSKQLPNLWHNRAVHPIPATVAVECLFARFAWTVLSPRVFDMFLPSTPVPRRLLLWNHEKGEWETEKASSRDVQEYTEECQVALSSEGKRTEIHRCRSGTAARGEPESL